MSLNPLNGLSQSRMWGESGKWEQLQPGFGLRRWKVTFGTPQGGVISPLLANIALHGMEAAVGVKYISRGQLPSSRTESRISAVGRFRPAKPSREAQS